MPLVLTHGRMVLARPLVEFVLQVFGIFLRRRVVPAAEDRLGPGQESGGAHHPGGQKGHLESRLCAKECPP